jgi:hypothetical protein
MDIARHLRLAKLRLMPHGESKGSWSTRKEEAVLLMACQWSCTTQSASKLSCEPLWKGKAPLSQHGLDLHQIKKTTRLEWLAFMA